MRQHVASFANFICRFGTEKVLLDYAEEIILPAFTDDKLIRSFGKGRTHYFFYESKVIDLNEDGAEPVLAITGKFIKNTTLSREQIFDPNKGVVKDVASIASAPSAFFVLILNNHRLIYFPETANAPDLKSFRSTALSFIKKKHKEMIERLYEESREKNERVRKSDLIKTHIPPTLEVIPISGGDDIEKFVRRYGKLNKVQFNVIRPNDEIDASGMFDKVRDYLDPMEPNDTKLITTKKDGFDLEKAVPRIKDASESANQQILLAGKDKDGNELRGDNHEFKVGAPIDPIPATRATLTEKLYTTFKDLVSNGTIKVGQFPDTVKQKISSLKNIL